MSISVTAMWLTSYWIVCPNINLYILSRQTLRHRILKLVKCALDLKNQNTRNREKWSIRTRQEETAHVILLPVLEQRPVRYLQVLHEHASVQTELTDTTRLLFASVPYILVLHWTHYSIVKNEVETHENSVCSKPGLNRWKCHIILRRRLIHNR